jgi:hypothetical protein
LVEETHALEIVPLLPPEISVGRQIDDDTTTVTEIPSLPSPARPDLNQTSIPLPVNEKEGRDVHSIEDKNEPHVEVTVPVSSGEKHRKGKKTRRRPGVEIDSPQSP